MQVWYPHPHPRNKQQPSHKGTIRMRLNEQLNKQLTEQSETCQKQYVSKTTTTKHLCVNCFLFNIYIKSTLGSKEKNYRCPKKGFVPYLENNKKQKNEPLIWLSTCIAPCTHYTTLCTKCSTWEPCTERSTWELHTEYSTWELYRTQHMGTLYRRQHMGTLQNTAHGNSMQSTAHGNSKQSTAHGNSVQKTAHGNSVQNTAHGNSVWNTVYSNSVQNTAHGNSH